MEGEDAMTDVYLFTTTSDRGSNNYSLRTPKSTFQCRYRICSRSNSAFERAHQCGEGPPGAALLSSSTNQTGKAHKRKEHVIDDCQRSRDVKSDESESSELHCNHV